MNMIGITRKKALMLTVALTLALFTGAEKTSAANILWVTDFFTDNSFSPPGSDVNDTNFIVILQNAGHNVWRFNGPNGVNNLLTAEQIDAINTNDLIIVGRATDSGAFNSGPQGNQWNTNITKPLMMNSSYLVRNSRLGWFTGETVPDVAGTLLTAVNLSDPKTAYIFGGVALNGNTTVDPFDVPIDRNLSTISVAPAAGGAVLATAASGATVIADFPAGTPVRSGTNVLAGYRMFFAAGSREAASPGGVVNAGKDNLTDAGKSIFLRAVEVALNNGLPPDVSGVPPLIDQQPQSVTVERFRPAAFSITVTQGTPLLKYQWYFNDSPLPGATGRSLSFTQADLTNNGQYFVIVTNSFGAATSSAVSLSVTQDITAPYIASVGSLDGRSIGVCFNEEVDITQGGITEAGNYEINGNGNAVLSVTVRPDNRSVRLDLIEPLTGAFTVHNSFLQDLAGNAGPSDAAGVVMGFVAADIGGPAKAGSHYTCDSNTVEVIGGGGDVWNTADQFYLASKSVSGNFDARVRVASLKGSNTITKAVIVARESTNADSRAFHVSVNPVPPGRDLAQMGLRTVTGGTTAAVGTNATPGGIPNAWLRITRVGDVFTGYRSTNAIDWVQIGQTNQTFPANMVIGFGVTAHDDTLLATGVFSGFNVTAGTGTDIRLGGASYVSGNFAASFQTESGRTYEVQYKNSLSDAGWTPLTNITGDGALKWFTNSVPAVPTRFYRVASP
jgi:hypothetical protein